ncbi:phage tail protein [Vibrio parahaemolyticus]
MGGSKKQTIGYQYYLGMHLIICAGKVDRFQLVRIGEKDITGSLYVERALGDYGYNPEIDGFKEYLEFVIGGSISNNSIPPDPEDWDGVPNSGLAGLSAFDIGCVMWYSHPEIFGGKLGEGGVSGSLRTYGGDPNQLPDDYLTSKIESDWPIPAYRGVTSVVMPRCYVGNTSYVKPIEFLVSRILRTTSYQKQWYIEKAVINGYDMNPTHIVVEALTDKEWGCGESSNDVDYVNMMAVADQLYDEGYGLSFLVNEQAKLEDFISEVLTHFGGVLRIGRDSGKYEMKLLRDDFDIDEIPHFNEDNIFSIKNFKRPSLAELPNSVIVTYWDLVLMEESTYKVYDPAAIAIQGGEVLKEVALTGVTNRQLAAKIAHRILAEESTPLATMSVEVDRSASNLNVGDVVALSWDEFNFTKTPFRILELKEEDFGKGMITLKVLQDVFSFYNILVDVDSGDILAPSEDTPRPVVHYGLIEIPYGLALQALTPEVLAGEDLEYQGLIGTVAVKPQTRATGYLVTYEETGEIEGTQTDFTPSLVLTADLGVTNTAFTATFYETEFEIPFDEMLDGGTVYDGIGYIGGEFVWVNYDTETQTGTLTRGGFDSTPQRHLSGQRLYLFSYVDGYGFAEDYFLEGELVKGWFSTVTPNGTLFRGLCPTDELTVQARHFLPNPPRNIKISDQVFNERVNFLPSGYDVTWVASDKLVEDHQLLSWFVTSGIKDANATYKVELLDEAETVIYTDDTLTTEATTLPALTQGTEYTLNVSTFLNGVESLVFSNIFKVKPNLPPQPNITAAEKYFNQQAAGSTFITNDEQYFDSTKTDRALYLQTSTQTELAGYSLLPTSSLWGEVLVFEFVGDSNNEISPDKMILTNDLGEPILGFGVVAGEACIELYLGSTVGVRVNSGVTVTALTRFKYIFDPYTKTVGFYHDGVLVSEVSVYEQLLSFAHRVEYGEVIDRIYYFTGDGTNASMYLSEISLTTYGERIAVDYNADLLINGYAELGRASWERNPLRPYVESEVGYWGLNPSEGTYFFSFRRTVDQLDDIWLQQTVSSARVYTKYGFYLTKIATLGSFDIRIDWMQGRPQAGAYGVDVEIQQYDINGAILSTTTSTTFTTASPDVMEAKFYEVPLNASAESFRVRFLGVADGTTLYVAVDECVASIVDASDQPPPLPEDIAALNVGSYGSISFLSAPETGVSSYGAYSFHSAPEAAVGAYGAVTFMTEIVQYTAVASYGAFSFMTEIPTGRNVVTYGAVSFHIAPDQEIASYGAVSFYSAPDQEVASYGAFSFHVAPDTLLSSVGAVSFLTVSTYEPTTILQDGSFELGDFTWWTTSGGGTSGDSIVTSSYELTDAQHGVNFFAITGTTAITLTQEVTLGSAELGLRDTRTGFFDATLYIANPEINYSLPDRLQVALQFLDVSDNLIVEVVGIFHRPNAADHDWKLVEHQGITIPYNAAKVVYKLQHFKDNTNARLAIDGCDLRLRVTEGAPVNLVVNGSFEDDLNGWTTSLGANAAVLTQTTAGKTPYEGTKLFGTNGNFVDDSYLSQTLVNTTGLTWTEVFDNYDVLMKINTIAMDGLDTTTDVVDVIVKVTYADNQIVTFAMRDVPCDSFWRRTVHQLPRFYGAAAFDLTVHVRRIGTLALAAIDEVAFELMPKPTPLTSQNTNITTMNAVTFVRGKRPTMTAMNAVTFVRGKRPTMTAMNAVTFVRPSP